MWDTWTIFIPRYYFQARSNIIWSLSAFRLKCRKYTCLVSKLSCMIGYLKDLDIIRCFEVGRSLCDHLVIFPQLRPRPWQFLPWMISFKASLPESMKIIYVWVRPNLVRICLAYWNNFLDYDHLAAIFLEPYG